MFTSSGTRYLSLISHPACVAFELRTGFAVRQRESRVLRRSRLREWGLEIFASWRRKRSVEPGWYLQKTRWNDPTK